MSIEDRIENAVEYFKDHPSKVHSFLNSELYTDDKVEIYIFESVKDRLMKEVVNNG